MVWIQQLWLRFQTLFRRDRSAQRLDDEIQFHLDQQIAENIFAGMSDEEARYVARRIFGNPTFLKETDELMEDIIRSINNIRKSPIKPRSRILESELPFFARMYCIINAEEEN